MKVEKNMIVYLVNLHKFTIKLKRKCNIAKLLNTSVLALKYELE